MTNPAELAVKIAQVHLQGWFLVNQELQEGLVSMAAPVFDNAGKMTAAFNVSDQANRTSVKTMQETMWPPPSLLAAAQSVSRLLGCVPDGDRLGHAQP